MCITFTNEQVKCHWRFYFCLLSSLVCWFSKLLAVGDGFTGYIKSYAQSSWLPTRIPSFFSPILQVRDILCFSKHSEWRSQGKQLSLHIMFEKAAFTFLRLFWCTIPHSQRSDDTAGAVISWAPYLQKRGGE